ncbi:hypothetical protein PybrP1_007282 [[Pythium] brassicae (nom. inval.)]|nr:hypothetical protein PybrP1_007282 [[Pythium] brassicae (nom. inval.)]
MAPEPPPSTRARVLRGHSGAVNAVRFNAKGSYVMTCGQDRSVRLWNPHRDGLVAPGEALLVKTYEGRHGYDVQDVAIANDNAQFASCGRDKAVFLWDVPTASVIRKFEGHEHSVNCVRYNVDSTVLLSGSYDKTIRAWDLRHAALPLQRNAYTPIQVLDDFKDSVTAMVVSDHEIIAGSVDGVVRTFDLRAGKLLREHVEEPVVSVALSPDARFLLAGCLDGSLRLLDKRDGHECHSYRGHRMGAYRIESCFSVDGAFALSGSEDGRVYAWDVLSGRVDSFPAHDRPVRALAAHPERAMLVTGSLDGTARVWTNECVE